MKKFFFNAKMQRYKDAKKLIFVPLCLCAFVFIKIFPCEVSAQQLDTTKIYNLQDIEVLGERITEERSTAPLQILESRQLENLNAFQVSDAVKHFAGVSVKDYGGIGGIKTVSVRSLGSTHTAISIDGIPVNDCQTGQVDIGRFSLENVDNLSLVNGQSDDIFQPAKLFASASVLSIQSKSPSFSENKKYNINIGSKFGSFEFFNPFLVYSQKLNRNFALNIDSEWMQADGDYPFTYKNGGQTVHEKRNNSDVKKLRAESSLYGRFSDFDKLQLKLYYYQSEQGLPGNITFYNSNSSSERIAEKNFFAQAHYNNNLSSKWAVQANTKYNYSYFKYLNQEVKENIYNQDEYYLSASTLFKPFRSLSLSLVCDGFYNSLDADLDNFAYPERYTLLSVLSGKYDSQTLSATASLLSTLVNEQIKTGKAGLDEQKLSPYASLSYKPFKKEELRLRFFYKNIFRLPSFNDLYYTNISNPKLKPENTNQYNAGITYVVRVKNILPIQITADIYYNNVTNKIMAVPKQSIFIWSMENVGEVEIKGLDITAGTRILYTKKRGISLQGSYTYQEAINITKGIKEYGHQIAYTPRFSGTGNCTIETRWFDISYSILISGKRYSLGQNIAGNSLSGYVDMGISLKRRFEFKNFGFFIQAEVLNLLDDNYEIVKSYPMPGRAFRASVVFSF